jgi:hypothetical protein
MPSDPKGGACSPAARLFGACWAAPLLAMSVPKPQLVRERMEAIGLVQEVQRESGAKAVLAPKIIGICDDPGRLSESQRK